MNFIKNHITTAYFAVSFIFMIAAFIYSTTTDDTLLSIAG